MKVYVENRGNAAKSDFDSESKQFALVPIKHPFKRETLQDVLLEKVRLWRETKRQENAQQEALHSLSQLSSEQRDDLGMDEFYQQARTAVV